ncbi:hypothetical protein [Actinomadura rudentiformis]|uniref:hypothetical protein n=1 Tax=Actinomadura rudentiformis TaxID=359158 RepID=UPI00178C6810|nr:hypothetical protein [Actinomadura rudentiformis]
MRIAVRVTLIVLLLGLNFVVSGFFPGTWYQTVISAATTGAAVALALVWYSQSRRKDDR